VGLDLDSSTVECGPRLGLGPCRLGLRLESCGLSVGLGPCGLGLGLEYCGLRLGLRLGLGLSGLMTRLHHWISLIYGVLGRAKIQEIAGQRSKSICIKPRYMTM